MMFVEYETRDMLMSTLAHEVADALETAIAKKGWASLALPGGTTPAPFLQALSKIPLNWSKVHVLLGDERFVNEDSPRSNTRLLKENFLKNEAASAHFIHIIGSHHSPEEAAQSALDDLAPITPLDVLVVGMGEDMHTASLFPDSPDLAFALSEDAPALVVIRSPSAGEPRLSLSGQELKNAKSKHILIVGEAKKAAYQKALAAPSEREAPIRTVLTSSPEAIIHYSK